MALSNWDLLASGTKKSFANGKISIDGIVISIYKNWLYIKENNKYKTLYSGHLTFDKFTIIAERSNQNSILVLVVYNDYTNKKKEVLFGIGCYGFSGSRWVGTKKTTLQKLKQFLEKQVKECYLEEKYIKNINWGDLTRFNQGDKFFEEKLNLESVDTKVGDIKPTIIEQML